MTQERWTNHIYKTREVEFIPASPISISPSYIVIIAFHLHDRTMWIIIIVHVHWTKLESASIQFKREDKVIWALCQINNNAYKSPFNILIMIFSSRPPKKRKEIKLFTRESSQQEKEEREIFLGFILITTTGMENKLAKSYNYFFWFFLRFFKHIRRKREK